MTLTADRAREMLNYDLETGQLRWRKTDGAPPMAKGGGLADRFNGKYLRVKIDGIEYMSHRVIWLIMTGEWPMHQVDHWDTSKINNAWRNLRNATSGQNRANRSAQSNNKSGLKGVCFRKKTKRWRASICKDKKIIDLGSFQCPAAASFAYQIAADNLYQNFARGF